MILTVLLFLQVTVVHYLRQAKAHLQEVNTDYVLPPIQTNLIGHTGMTTNKRQSKRVS